ncbi:MAG: hypothetical protein IT259_13055, partial [Saprospiraceae bacterium]|nr:hypothetical protein [Saprospiraceae bacterium]
MKKMPFSNVLLPLFCCVIFAGAGLQAQELYKPGAAGVKRQFDFKLPMSTKAQRINVEVIDNLVIYEGDVILCPLVSFEGEEAVAIDGASYRWPNATIPYVISSGHP